MKNTLFLLFASIILITTDLSAKDKIRIGIYDSRIVAIFNFQSEEFQKEMRELRTEYLTAKEKKDSVLAKKLEEKGQLTQRILHDKGFGRGSVAEILEKKSEELKVLAKKENLSVIVSKWELNYSIDAELVDITLQMGELFSKDTEKIKKMMKDLTSNPPVKDAFFIED